MKKQPYMPFYTGDWLKDPRLSLCSPATRGVWIDLICALHELPTGGQVTGTPDQLARLCRCTVSDMHSAISELHTTQAADINEREGVYSIVCRRLRKEAEISRLRSIAGSKSKAKSQQKPEGDNEDEILRKVQDFSGGLGLPESDARWFFHKCEANGWTNGGQPIRDWKQTIRSWFAAGYMPSQKNGRRASRDLNI